MTWTTHNTVEQVLQHYQPQIGRDYIRYRNHVYRVFFNCLLLDPATEHEVLYAHAAVLHDIGIWTDHTIDYLEPSAAQARIYLASSGKEQWIPEISAMICWHHKISPYTGAYRQVVECFRKADWIDVSFGMLRFGTDKKELQLRRKQWPNAGFHLFLARKLCRNFFVHPLHPFPMFRK